MPFSPLSDILADLRNGKMVVLTDDEHRENEGDLVLPAQFASPEAITFLLKEAKGYLCLSLPESDCDRLDLHPQSTVNTTVRGTAFTVSVDLHPRHGGTTGVSARERAACIRRMIDPTSSPADFVRPGHINPLRSRTGGTLVRTGQTEGSIDLCRLAGLTPAAAIIEIMRDDGEMARLPDLKEFCNRHHLKMCSVAQIIQHRLARESLVRRLDPARGTPIRTALGDFNLIAFESLVDPLPHVALTVGGVGDLDASGQPIESPEPTLVRMHRRNVLGDLFLEHGHGAGGAARGAGEGPSGSVLHESMRMIQKAGRGAIVYLRPEGDGPGIAERLNQIRREHGAQAGSDSPELSRPDSVLGGSVPRNMRQFGIGGQILRNLGLSRLRLITNHATEMPGLEAFGLSIEERVGVGAVEA